MTYLQIAVKVIEAPLKFFHVNAMFILSCGLSSMMITPQAGYPWPGFLSYSVPSIVFLFLGTLLAIAFVYVHVLAPIRGWGRLFSFLLACVACSNLLMAVTPEKGLIGFVCLIVLNISLNFFLLMPFFILTVIIKVLSNKNECKKSIFHIKTKVILFPDQFLFSLITS